jgi:hypothetical protein
MMRSVPAGPPADVEHGGRFLHARQQCSHSAAGTNEKASRGTKNASSSDQETY